MYAYRGHVMRALAAGDRVIVVAVCGYARGYQRVNVVLSHAMRGHGAMKRGGCRLRDQCFVVFDSWLITYLKRGSRGGILNVSYEYG